MKPCGPVKPGPMQNCRMSCVNGILREKRLLGDRRQVAGPVILMLKEVTEVNVGLTTTGTGLTSGK